MTCDFYYVWWWTWAFIPVVIAIIRSKPIIITGVFDHYIDDVPEDFPKRSILHQVLIKFALRYSSANIFVSKLEEEHIKKHFVSSTSYINPHCVDLNLYAPRSNIKRDDNLLVCISWQSKENVKRKCLVELIQSISIVVKEFPEVKLVIVGKEGDGLPYLLEEVRKRKLETNIIFTGPISEERKIKYLRECTMYLQPTLVEGFGLAILEAMACGAPVISSKRGTVPEVLGDAGLYADPIDVADIAQKIQFLLNNKLVAKDLSYKGIERSKLFSYHDRLNRSREIFDDILS